MRSIARFLVLAGALMAGSLATGDVEQEESAAGLTRCWTEWEYREESGQGCPGWEWSPCGGGLSCQPDGTWHAEIMCAHDVCEDYDPPQE